LALVLSVREPAIPYFRNGGNAARLDDHLGYRPRALRGPPPGARRRPKPTPRSGPGTSNSFGTGSGCWSLPNCGAAGLSTPINP